MCAGVNSGQILSDHHLCLWLVISLGFPEDLELCYHHEILMLLILLALHIRPFIQFLFKSEKMVGNKNPKWIVLFWHFTTISIFVQPKLIMTYDYSDHFFIQQKYNQKLCTASLYTTKYNQNFAGLFFFKHPEIDSSSTSLLVLGECFHIACVLSVPDQPCPN